MQRCQPRPTSRRCAVEWALRPWSRSRTRTKRSVYNSYENQRSLTMTATKLADIIALWHVAPMQPSTTYTHTCWWHEEFWPQLANVSVCNFSSASRSRNAFDAIWACCRSVALLIVDRWSWTRVYYTNWARSRHAAVDHYIHTHTHAHIFAGERLICAPLMASSDSVEFINLNINCPVK